MNKTSSFLEILGSSEAGLRRISANVAIKIPQFVLSFCWMRRGHFSNSAVYGQNSYSFKLVILRVFSMHHPPLQLCSARNLIFYENNKNFKNNYK
jgi:hypothetical protein